MRPLSDCPPSVLRTARGLLFDIDDTLTTDGRLTAAAYGRSLNLCKADDLFASDSLNDAPMFGYFPYSVGVANVRDFAGRLSCEPAYITCCRAGDGFAELAQHLIQVR